jgi:hypothetical protein
VVNRAILCVTDLEILVVLVTRLLRRDLDRLVKGIEPVEPWCHGTDLRVVMTRCCYDTSTDLTPERRVYIPPHLPYIVPHTISFVNTTQYLVPCRHVL